MVDHRAAPEQYEVQWGDHGCGFSGDHLRLYLFSVREVGRGENVVSVGAVHGALVHESLLSF